MVDDTRAAVASASKPEAVAQERITTSIKEAEDRATQAERGGGMRECLLTGIYSQGGR
jgi:hypothetical protein